ncbi:MAG: HEAT repeat domain-containing protein [Planctomycetota bacterium]
MSRRFGAVLTTALLGAGLTGQAAAPTAFERGLVAALAADDARVRHEALMALEWVGTASHVEAIAKLLDDDDPELQVAALRCLGLIAESDPAALPAALPLLRRALRDRSQQVVIAALRALAGLPLAGSAQDDWSDVEGLLAHAWLPVRIEAASTLVHGGAAIHPRDVSALLGDAASSWQGYRLLPLFDRVDDPEQRPLMEAFLREERASMRFRAREALLRLDARAADATVDARPESQRVRERAQRENAEGAAALAKRPWTEVEPDALLAAAGAARLVLFGEIHEPEGPLRLAQQRVLRAMVERAPGRVVVGFEPSVEAAQRSVLDLATELGAEVRSMEPGDFRTLCDEVRYAERDELCGAEIRRVFDGDPEVRMLVLRGESHVTPGGHLCRLLPVPPMVVVSVTFPPLHAIGDRPELVDRTFRRGDDGAVWVWCIQELLQGKDALRAWLEAR